jgi:TolA-binding protein
MKQPSFIFSRLPLVLLPLLLAAGCGGKNIETGPQIKDIAAGKDKKAPEDLPIIRSEEVAPSTDKALENYQELLDLPQDPATRAETMRRLADLQLESDEAGGASFEQSEQRLRQSVALYTTLLKDYPDAPGNDRVLYQLARAYQNLGETAKAEAALSRLTREFPQSEYADDAHFRRAELLFRLGDFDQAAGEYRYVIELKEQSPFYEPAQYKYGWSLFKQSNYEGALTVFLTVLSRELPPGELSDPKTAIEGVQKGKKDIAQDALRVVSLSLAGMGGGEAANRYFARRGEPAYAPLLYAALGENLLEKKRYTDSAKAYVAFITAHPKHALAPSFQSRAIAAQQEGGFGELVMQEKERYARAYDPAAPYWTGRSAAPEVLKELRGHFEDLARHYQAKGQKNREQGGTAGRDDFLAATRWYRRLLELYLLDPKAAELRFLMAEAYFEAGETLTAAREYNKVAADHPAYEKSADAAYAAVLAYQRYGAEAPAAERPAALRQAVQASLQLAEKYPQHPEALTALTRAAEDLYQLQAWDEAIAAAARVLKAIPPARDSLRRTAWGVTADAQFSQKRYADSEIAYGELLKLTAPQAGEGKVLRERLASAIYKQGEAARAAGDQRKAADAFLRVGRMVPDAGIRAASDYDAAAALIALKDWVQAAAVLEAFRVANAGSALLPDVDKKLVAVYQSSGRPKEAAATLKRIAASGGESLETRRDAAWLAVSLLDQASDPQIPAEYETYLKQFPQPADRAMEARNRLAQLAALRGDETRRLHWLREIIEADKNAGQERSARSKLLAAEAVLEFGRIDARKAAGLRLSAPLGSSLPAKKQAIERAISTLSQAADYGFAEVTTAATFELGALYQDFSKSLLASDRPKKLSALELEQYGLLLEEQAFPIEEKAIQWHEANLQRVPQGVYNEWVGKSMQALAQIAPGKYGKREKAPEIYDALR